MIWTMLLTGCLCAGVAIVALFEQLYLITLIMLSPAAYLIYAFKTTQYIIDTQEKILAVRSGFYSLRVPIQNIRKILPVHSILNSPALSYDKIEIFYDKYESVMISPENEADFIRNILLINDRIEYQNKKP